MGNILGGGVLSSSKKEVSYLYDGTLCEKWSISYTVEGSTSELQVTKLVGQNGKVKSIFFELTETVLFANNNNAPQFQRCKFTIIVNTIQTNNNNLLQIGYNTCAAFNCIITEQKASNVATREGFTTTHLHFYGSGNVGGLIVLESKIKTGDASPYAVALAHYYTKSSGNIFTKTKTDGFSVVARIRACNGNLDLTVEGPEQHPASGLFYMFDDVSRTGIWKPTVCPHCALKVRMQRGKTCLVSDSEDDSGPAPVSHLRSSQSSAKRGLANIGGAYHGNGNGNWNEGNVYNHFNF